MKISSPRVDVPLSLAPPEPSSPPSVKATSFRDVLAKASGAARPSTSAPETAGPVGQALRSVAASHREMDRIIRVVSSGRSFTSAQLIGLQARVHRLSTEIDLASKLLEKATSGVKQAMSTQL